FDSAVAIVGAPTVNPGDESRLQLADITGDGLADLVLAGVAHVDYCVFQPAYGFSPVQTISGTPYASASLTEVRLGDMNGNGSVDVIWFPPTAAVSDRVVYLDVQDGVRPNVLSTVENGLGLKRTLKYSTSADQYQAAM